MFEADGWIGARTEYKNGGYDMAMFRTASHGVPDTVAVPFNTDANRIAATVGKKGKMSRFFVVQGTGISCADDTTFVFKCESTVTAAVAYGDSTVSIEAESEQDTGVVLTVYKAPDAMITKDGEFENWSYDNKAKAGHVHVAEGI